MEKKIVKLYLSNDPNIHTRSVLFGDNAETIKKKNKKQFVTTKDCSLTVFFDDESTFVLKAKKGYTFDGATIPFNIGKGDMRLLIPALFHDIMCDDKACVSYNRKLSSAIFYKALLECGKEPFIAKLMYEIVDVYQTPIWFIAKIKARIKKWIREHLLSMG